MRVLVIGDTHCPAMHPRYPDWLEEIYSQWQCERAVHIGDLVDNAALNFHKKHCSLKDPIREKEKAFKQVQELVRRFPRADWLEGNHDCMVARWFDEVGLPQEWMRKPTQVWKTGKWKHHPRYTTLKLDGCYYRHGDMGKGGTRLAAVTNAVSEGVSVIQGHHHTQGGCEYMGNSRGRIFGMQTGTGVNPKSLHFEYGRKFGPGRTILGCGVVVDGEVAYFEPMPDRLAKELK